MLITGDYFTNGIRVDEIPSSVGLDWNLNAGGHVSRVVRNEPDGSSTYLAPPSDLSQKNQTLYCLEPIKTIQKFDIGYFVLYCISSAIGKVSLASIKLKAIRNGVGYFKRAYCHWS
jgi:hypothetical protein